MKSAPSSQRRRNLCAFHRRGSRTLAFAALLAASASAAHATDYTYSGNTGNFSTGFTPAVSGATPADDLIFGGAAYTATDDVSGLSVNGYRFNNTGTVVVAQGTGDNTITLGAANAGNAFIDFNNTGLVTVATNTAFVSNGYIVKSTGGAAATNPIISGGISLASGTNVNVVLADTPGDAAAELTLSGVISGAGSLTLQNNANIPAASAGNMGIAAPANQQDYGTLLITGNNTYTGGTNINSGRLVITSGTAFGTGTITVGGANTSTAATPIVSTGGTLALGNGNYTTVGASGVIPTAGITIANALNLAGAITGVYAHGLENNTGNNTFSGVVTLEPAAAGGANSTSIVQVNNLTTLSFTGGVAQAAGDVATLTKQGNGTLIMNNASYTGGTTISAGAVQFNGTAPTAGQVTIAAGAALNAGPGSAYTSIQTLLTNGVIASTSTGSINLTGNDAENLDFNGTTNLSLGSAVNATANTPQGAVFTGTIQNSGNGQDIYLGGGQTGLLTLPNNNQLADNILLQVGPAGANGKVAILGTNPLTTQGSSVAISGGTLEFGAGSLGTAGITFGGITPTGGGGTLQYAPGNTEDITANGRPVVNNGPTIIDTNGNNVSWANTFTTGTTQGAFTKTGLGTLTLNAVNGMRANGNTAAVTNGAELFVRQGSLTLTGAAATFVTANGFQSIGQLQGDFGTLNLTNGATDSTASDFNVGDVGGVVGVAGTLSDGGVVNVSGTATNLFTNTLYVGKGGADIATANTQNNGALVVGVLNQSGGTVTTTGNSQIGVYGQGQYNLTGGTMANSGQFVSVGRQTGGFGTLDVNGGAFTDSTLNGSGRFIVGENGTGVLNVRNGGSVTVTSTTNNNGGFLSSALAGLTIGNTPNVGGVGIVNLLPGGTINTPSVGSFGSGETSLLNFNGGILANTAATTTFIQNLTAATVYSGGAIINTAGGNATIPQALIAPAGNGVTGITAGTATGTFTTTPIVQITGGGGVGATAVATGTVNSNGTFTLTGFTITNPGTGYTSAPTVAIIGPSGATSTATAAIGLDVSGGLTKMGTNTLTLTGTNTYTGNVLIAAGTLAAGSNSALGNGGSITIGNNTAAAVLTINAGVTVASVAPRLTIVSTGANTGSLNLLGAANTIQETVGQFVVNGVFQPVGTYGAAGSGATFTSTFITGTGELNVTAIPEPGTWALLGLGVVALGAVEYRRRRQQLA